MNQKKLLLILAGTALAILAVAGLGISGSSLGWFGGDGAQDTRRLPGALGGTHASTDDDEAAEFAASIVGRDEHGEYRIGADGRRVYRDDEGRFFIVDPDGKRVFTDARGRARAGGGTLRHGDAAAPVVPPSVKNETSPLAVDEDGDSEADAATISGSVVDEEGKPFSGATVFVKVTGGPVISAKADEDGLFNASGIPAGKAVEVYAYHSATSDAVSNRIELTPQGPTRLQQALVLPRECGIRGTVRGEGGAVSGAEIVLYEITSSANPAGRVKATAQGGPDGAFAFPKLARGKYRLQVSRDGYAPTMLANISPPKTLDVWLSAGARVSGRVTNEAGDAIKGALISCDFVSEPVQNFHTETVTDADGNYAVSCQPESQQNIIKVIAPGYHSRSRNYVRSGATSIDFKLQPTGNVILRGRLMRKSGEAIATATLQALDAEGKNARIAQRIGPAADGAFWAEVVPAGVKLRIRSAGLAELMVDYTPVEGGEVQLGDLVMDAGGVVFGAVRDAADKSPVDLAKLRIGSITVNSDKEGRYRIEGLNFGQVTLVVECEEYSPLSAKITLTAAAPEVERNIELTRGQFEARVLVRDAETLDPVAEAEIIILESGRQFKTGADGIAQLKAMTRTSGKIFVRMEGYPDKEAGIAAWSPGVVGTKPPQEILISRGGMIQGAVTSGGEPLPGVRVDIWDSKMLLANVVTDPQGRYTSKALGAGDYFVGMANQGIAPRHVALTLEGVTQDFEVGLVCHLRGRILRHGGSAHGSAGIYVYRRDNIYHAQTIFTDPDGKYEVMNLFPGQWVFCILKSQGDQAAQYSIPVNVATAGWGIADIQLPQATGVMTGRVTYPNGSPARNARVCVTNLGANFTRACLGAYVVTDSNGFYRAERLENGAQMIARVGGYSDGAGTGTAFSQAVLIPASEVPVEADIVVPNVGLGFNVGFSRADAGPLLDSSTIAYLVDTQGRVSGLYFGGGRYKGNIAMRDVVPGTYTLIVTSRGMKAAQAALVVGQEAPQDVQIFLEPETRGG